MGEPSCLSMNRGSRDAGHATNSISLAPESVLAFVLFRLAKGRPRYFAGGRSL